MAAQSCWLYVGQELLCCTAAGERHRVRNGCGYTVQEIDMEAHATKLVGLERWFDVDEVRDLLRLSHARTYASVQGHEFDGSVCLADMGHPRFTLRHLFLGLSHCRDAGAVRVE